MKRGLLVEGDQDKEHNSGYALMWALEWLDSHDIKPLPPFQTKDTSEIFRTWLGKAEFWSLRQSRHRKRGKLSDADRAEIKKRLLNFEVKF